MCTNPVTIKNPNYDSRLSSIEQKRLLGLKINQSDREYLNKFPYKNLHNRCITHIQVPCGYCDECRLVRSSELIQRCEMESIGCNVFMFTLTYDNKHLPIYEFNIPSNDTGEFETINIPFSDFSHITSCFKRIRTILSRSENPFPFRYCVVSERGSLHHRPHFHGLIFVPNAFDPYIVEKRLYDLVLDNWSINIGSRKHPEYEKLFTLKKRFINGKPSTNYDLHYVRPSDVSGCKSPFYYIGKYITKYDPYTIQLKKSLYNSFKKASEFDNSDKDLMSEFNALWRLIKPKIVCSRSFGLGGLYNTFPISDYLRKCVDKSYSLGRTYPCFYDNVTGKESKLCHYFQSSSTCITKSKINAGFNELVMPFFDADDAILFYMNDEDNAYTDTFYVDETTYDALVKRCDNNYRRLNKISSFDHHLDDVPNDIVQLNINF